MNRITFVLRLGMKGAAVADLQDALRLLVDQRELLARDPTAAALLAGLQRERAGESYGDATGKLVSAFQGERRLPTSGMVDTATASALNTVLEGLGVLPKPSAETAFLDPRFIVPCKVVDLRGAPVAGLRLEAYNRDPKGPPNALGDGAVTDRDGLATFYFKRTDYTGLPVESGPDLFFKLHRGNTQIGYTVQGLPTDRGAIPNFQPQRLPVTLRVEKHYVVAGRIRSANGLPAAKLTLWADRLVFGGKEQTLGSAVTDEAGRYAVAYDPGPGPVNLEIRMPDPQDSNKQLSLMKPLYSASPYQVLNLVAPAVPQEAEYRRLSNDLRPHIGDVRNLAGAREGGDRHDLTLLNRATGWDARLIALSALAERLRAGSEGGAEMTSEAVYGLLRAGLPSDKQLLALISPGTAAATLKQMSAAGIVSLTEEDMARFKLDFTRFANATRLQLPAPGSPSSYADLFKASGLDQAALDIFEPIYFSHRGDPAGMWAEAAKPGNLGAAQIETLKLHGKLAFVAGNSAGMTARLMSKQVEGKSLTDPVQLVDLDLYQSGKCKDEILEQANVPAAHLGSLSPDEQNRLGALIPTACVADKLETRLEAYAREMARKVSLSYPTHVVRRLMETDANYRLPLAHDDTVALLRSASETGFLLGQTPVRGFLRDHPELFAGATADEQAAAQKGLETVARLYQITPDHASMPVLVSLRISSAYDVMAFSKDQFVAAYAAKYRETYGGLPASSTASGIYDKASQVSSVTYNIFSIAKTMVSAPTIPVASPSADAKQAAHDELVKAYPNMESLFGSMDYCECEACRSVLSPAAYLTDLLQFVDIEDSVWENFKAQWKASHDGHDYAYGKPYDILAGRRPDLPNIQLTCGNTNTVMPYIDIANEIMEYDVACGKLDAQAAHDTGDVTSDELLAEPQNVIAGAYDVLREARYPLNLPFDLWIETARQFCNYFETPLEDLLETFRPGDDLFAPGSAYDRAATFYESLCLSPAEVQIFTDGDPLTGGKWYDLFGYGPGPALLASTNTAPAATVTLPNPTTPYPYAVGDPVTYRDASAGAVQGETLTIAGIGAADSGGAGRTLVRLDGLWNTPPGTGDQLIMAAPTKLRSAKALSRRLGLTYQEIVDVVQTGFVNPRLGDLALFSRLGVSIHDARLYQLGQLSSDDDQAFEARLSGLAADAGSDVASLRAYVKAIPFSQILELADTDAGCNFDLTTLQYADGGAAKPIDFLRLSLFVRLWRKLGWTIEETDRTLCTFIPSGAPYDETHLAQRPLQTALIYLAHLKTLDGELNVGQGSRLKLLTLWSPIATAGKTSLYARLFLSPGILKSDPVFDDPLGNYLSKTLTLSDHLPAVQGALGLTAAEIGLILGDAGQSVDTASLSLDNLSLLYRYKLLAKALGLSVCDLITLKSLSGLDPFRPLRMAPLATLDDDGPFTQTLRFVDLAGQVQASALTIEDLDYLLRHRFDATGKYRPDPQAVLLWLKGLALGIRSIRAAHAVPADPSTLSDDRLKAELGLVLPADVAATFLAMQNGSQEYTATLTLAATDTPLDPDSLAGERAIVGVKFETVTRVQSLTFRGVLLDAQKADLETRLPQPAPKQPFTPSPVLNALLENVQTQAQAFFDKYLLKAAPGAQPDFGFLDQADYDLLFAPLAGSPADQQAQREGQLARLAAAFFPYLQERLIHQWIVASLVAYTHANAALVESLAADVSLLHGEDGRTLLAALQDCAQSGVSAAFYDSADLSGVPQQTPSVADTVDMALKPTKTPDGATALNPAGSARFVGYLEVPQPGAYRFFVALDDAGARAALRFDHLPDPLFLDVQKPADPHDDYLELQAGILYSYTLELTSLNGAGARLLVQGETLPKDRLSQLSLYPLSTLSAGRDVLLLLGKVLEIAQALELDERELRYLLTHGADFGNLEFSSLPVQPSGDSPAEAAAATTRFGGVLQLLAYTSLKSDLAAGTDDLIDVFEANGAGDLAEAYALIAKLTRREADAVQAAAETLWAKPSFASEVPLQRLWEALQAVERFGVPAAAVAEWTGIVNPTTAGDQRFGIACDLRQAIKARYTPDAWQRAARSIFDRLRQLQRDALVAYLLAKKGFERLDQLYELYLIDPGMEPVVQTSRIRLAIGSVQLFIQRCLLNLEAKVHPSAIVNARYWDWMKRYRVWEANRKIFLFPENWLEPEFRDDKTQLFADLEGILLQDDVSNELVEDAFLDYLRKLDELARLDIVALHVEDNADPARRILHVVGRTYTQPHKYYYRRCACGMWTPWEPVSAEIDGDHLAPVVWRDRLFLFWVTFVEKPYGALKINDRARDANNQTASTQGPAQTLPDLPDDSRKTTLDINDDTDLSTLKFKELMRLSGTQLPAQPPSTDANGKPQPGLTLAAPIPPAVVVPYKILEAELHWSEYINGDWSTHESGGQAAVISVVVQSTFQPSALFVYATKGKPVDGGEGGVLINLIGANSEFNRAFFLAGRNSAPQSAPIDKQPGNPFSATKDLASRYWGSGPLGVSYHKQITTVAMTPTGQEDPPPSYPILNECDQYTLLPCDNDLTALGVPPAAYEGLDDASQVKQVLEKHIDEIAMLLKPVFYQDNANTFYIQPDITETTTVTKQDSVSHVDPGQPGYQLPGDIQVVAQQPALSKPDPGGPVEQWSTDPIDTRARNKVQQGPDWMVNQGTLLSFGDSLVGQNGDSGLTFQSAATGETQGASLQAVKVHTGSVGARAGRLLVGDSTAYHSSGLAKTSGGYTVVGKSGFTYAQKLNFNAMNVSAVSAAKA